MPLIEWSTEYAKKQIPVLEKEIRSIMEKLDLDRMPCKSEIFQATGSYSVDLRIQRSGGYEVWADRLGIQPKNQADNINDNYVRDIEGIKTKLLAQKSVMLPKEASTAQTNMSMLSLWNTSRKRHTAGLLGRKIKSAEEMEQYINEFMLFCADNNLRPNMNKLAIWLDYTEGVIVQIMNDCNDERSASLQKAKALFDEMMAENIVNTTTPTGDIFVAKARYGWVEAEKDKRLSVNIQLPARESTFNKDDFVDDVIEVLPEMIEGTQSGDETAEK